MLCWAGQVPPSGMRCWDSCLSCQPFGGTSSAEENALAHDPSPAGAASIHADRLEGREGPGPPQTGTSLRLVPVPELPAGSAEGLGTVSRPPLLPLPVPHPPVPFAVVMPRVHLRTRCGPGSSSEAASRGTLCENDGGWSVGSYFPGVLCLM